MNALEPLPNGSDSPQYLGLAPFLRSSIAGTDLRLLANQILSELQLAGANPNALMNLSIAVQCLCQMELGMAFQKEALTKQHTYRIAARVQPARLRLLVLVTQGNIQSYTPLECLLEVSDIELIFHYVFANENILSEVPEHDVLFVGIADSDENRALLDLLQKALKDWQHPVLNAPKHLRSTGRDVASTVLANIPNLLMPPTARVSRTSLQSLAQKQTPLSSLTAAQKFPIILRPLGSQAGKDLQKINSNEDVSSYLDSVVDAQDFFIAPFIDYSDADGLYKKIRIALIGGEPYVCHMAVSSNWMVHYVNAGMYEDSWKRREEARFMSAFDSFVKKHRSALDAISERMQLEYLVMDCAETQAGELLLFEIDHGGVVHAMDVESLFPYKNEHIRKAQIAFSEMLYALVQQKHAEAYATT